MKVVVDTNVIVSGILKPESLPAKILNLVLSEKLLICADSRIVSEYRNVLLREKFGFPKKLVNDLIDFIESTSILVSPPPISLDLIDKGDLPFIEVALFVNVPIITGNKKHFQEIKDLIIYTPNDFLKLYKTR
ncbi:putative toxin-antitoxin system toxin component, PIN family [Thermosipho globiformans]|uniref:putative toxin-antitoxin system toxin component, PIN family n=1 Tax=Thermosipho globiformans TaxID=380685 RepID=UPI000F8ED1B2|nr:putative toxin-antitoxin system toxin component, PIN family [Thermosipho globiformans]